jgi:Ca2+-binding RTX toxin-like protein
MRRAGLWLTVMGATLILASGVALAAVIQCVPGAASCDGTDQADQITGTDGPDVIFAEGGDDTVTAGAGNDQITGDGDLATNDGKDTIFAGSGDDEFGAFGRSDMLIGGPGNDTIHAVDSAPKGFDAVRGEKGNDTIDAVDSVKDNINCGGGTDQVTFDKRIDVVAADCERLDPQ